MFGRHLNWFTQSPGGLLFHPDDDGGGGWPEYDVPSGVGGGDDGGTPPAADPQRQPAGQPGAAGQPAGDANGNRGDGQPAARQPQGAPQGTPQGGRRNDLPQYRQDQIAARDASREQARIEQLVNERIRETLSQAFGIGKPAGQPEDPRAARIRESLFGVIPGLKELLENREQLLAAAQSGQQWTETNKNYWQGVAARTMGSLHDGAAVALLGAGKAGKDLDAETRADIQSLFIRWVESDQTQQRVGRYEAQDPNLVREFLTAWQARYIDPVRRSAAVTVQQRGQQRAAVPTNGPGAMPPAAKPPQQDNQDEDAVHGRGWALVQQLRAGQ